MSKISSEKSQKLSFHGGFGGRLFLKNTDEENGFALHHYATQQNLQSLHFVSILLIIAQTFSVWTYGK